MSKSIILIEGNEDFEILKNDISLLSESKTISFDFLAHRKLKNLNISHELLEDYFTVNDRLVIDTKTIELTTTWYNHDCLKSYIEYNGLNVGNILQSELIGYFFMNLKRSLGIIRVIERETPNKIICSSLGNFLNALIKDSGIEIIVKPSKSIPTPLYFDPIEIPIQVRGKVISLKISRSKFLKLKKTTESIVDLLFSFKPNFDELANKQSIVLLDFNPLLYRNLLKSLSDSHKSVILLNQRRPAVWNLESLSVMRKSGCKIIKLDDFANTKNLSKIQKERNYLKTKLSEMWSDESIFNEIFSVDNISFWSAIRENFMNIINTRSEELVERFVLVKELFENVKMSHILEWAQVGSEEKVVLFLASQQKIPIILLQHGLYPINEKFEKYISLTANLPYNGAKEAVWGNIMKDYLLQHKINPEQILVTGSPRHDIFFERRTSVKDNDSILILSSIFFGITVNGTDTKAYEFLEAAIRRICEVIRRYPNKKIVVKLHFEKAYFDLKPLFNEIDPSIKIYQNQNILNQLESCDSVIALNFSTALLDAMIMNKPTMVILADNQNFEQEEIIKRKTTIAVSKLDDLEKSINDLLFDTNTRNELIKNANEFVNEYLANQGTSSEYLSKILSK